MSLEHEQRRTSRGQVEDKHLPSRFAREAKSARRRVRENSQRPHPVRVPLEHDQRLAARDRVDDVHLLIIIPTTACKPRRTRRRVREDR